MMVSRLQILFCLIDIGMIIRILKSTDFIFNIIFYLLQQLKDELGEVVAELEALDGQEECKQNSKAKQMSIGRKKFNMDPKKGEQKVYKHSIECTTSPSD